MSTSVNLTVKSLSGANAKGVKVTIKELDGGGSPGSGDDLFTKTTNTSGKISGAFNWKDHTTDNPPFGFPVFQIKFKKGSKESAWLPLLVPLDGGMVVLPFTLSSEDAAIEKTGEAAANFAGDLVDAVSSSVVGMFEWLAAPVAEVNGIKIYRGAEASIPFIVMQQLSSRRRPKTFQIKVYDPVFAAFIAPLMGKNPKQISKWITDKYRELSGVDAGVPIGLPLGSVGFAAPVLTPGLVLAFGVLLVLAGLGLLMTMVGIALILVVTSDKYKNKLKFELCSNVSAVGAGVEECFVVHVE